MACASCGTSCRVARGSTSWNICTPTWWCIVIMSEFNQLQNPASRYFGRSETLASALRPLPDPPDWIGPHLDRTVPVATLKG